MEFRSGCVVCGQELAYLCQNEQVDCYYCGQSQETNVRCSGGHFVCDRCHSLAVNNLTEQYCIHTNQTDPLEIAITLMKNPVVKMHGPEHHFLVPAVLLTAFYNQGRSEKKAEKIRQARQ